MTPPRILTDVFPVQGYTKQGKPIFMDGSSACLGCYTVMLTLHPFCASCVKRREIRRRQMRRLRKTEAWRGSTPSGRVAR